MSYFVVYENDETTGLHYGCRYYVEHESEERVDKHPQPNTTVIAKGVTQEEAINLLSLSPEICLVASVIDSYGDNISFKHLPILETEVREKLSMARKTIQRSNLIYLDASPYIAQLKNLAKQDTYQAAVLKGYIARICDQYTGQILTF